MTYETTYLTDIWIMTAKIAGKYLDYGKYPSGYCLFDTFCPSDEVDEVLENALSWKEYAETLPEEFTEQVQQIWQLWMKNRRELEQIYHTLPTSVFQADLNPTNLLIDENGKFVGVYDFNLCGKDVFLNYLPVPAVDLIFFLPVLLSLIPDLILPEHNTHTGISSPARP